MVAATARRRRSTRTPTRSASRQTGFGGGGPRLPRPPSGIGNIIGVVLLVVAAFVAGYLVGRAGPPVMATEQDYLVSRVVDGDTVELSDGSRVRYLGIDTPERGELLYEEATERNRELVEGSVVELVAGETDADAYGRLLRYVYADGVMVNAVLVEEGLARVLILDEAEVHAALFRSLEEQARGQARGLWAFE